MRRLTVLVALVLLVATGQAATGSDAHPHITKRSVSLHASSTHVTGLTTITLSGRVTSTPKGAAVRIERQVGKVWQLAQKVRTRKGGAFTATIKPGIGPHRYRARVLASALRSGATSTVTTVVVDRPAALTLTTSEALVRTGSSVTLSGQESPFVPRSAIALQHQVSSGPWVSDGVSSLNASGQFTFTRVPATGVTTYRVTVGRVRISNGSSGAVYLAAATSAPVTVSANPSGSIATLTGISDTATGAYVGNWASPDRLSYYTTGTTLGVISVSTTAHTLTINGYDTTTYTRVGTPITVSFSDLPDYGGVYTAADGTHYLLVGQDNHSENDNLNAVAVRRYDASWTLTGTAYIKGGATQQGVKGIYEPFEASAPKMLQVGGKLVVHMGRLIYGVGSPVVHHQVDLTFEVDLATMAAATFDDLSGGSAPYASHSFNQFVGTRNGELLLIDHGDAYPRGIELSVVTGYPSSRTVDGIDVWDFDGATDDNFTGTRVTGFATGPSGALVVGSSQPHDQAVGGVTGSSTGWSQNIFVISADPDSLAAKPAFSWLTTFSPTGTTTVYEPRITPIGPDRYALLFSTGSPAGNGTYTEEYRLLDSAGHVLGTHSFAGAFFSPISDPVLVGSHLLWAGHDSPGSNDLFLYGLDLTDPTGPKRLGAS